MIQSLSNKFRRFRNKRAFSVKLLGYCWGWHSTVRCYFVISKTFPWVFITKSCTSLKYWWNPKFHINKTQPRYWPGRRRGRRRRETWQHTRASTSTMWQRRRAVRCRPPHHSWSGKVGGCDCGRRHPRRPSDSAVQHSSPVVPHPSHSHLLDVTFTTLCRLVTSRHSFIQHPSTMNIFSTRRRKYQQRWMLGLLSIRTRMSSQPVHSLSSLLHYNKIRENAYYVELTLICGQTTGNSELIQLLFLNGHHLEPEVHDTSNVPSCVDSFLVQGTSYTSIPPSSIACTGRSMIAWHSINAVIMCTAHKTSWREVKLQQRPHSLGQLFIKSWWYDHHSTENEEREEAEGTCDEELTIQKDCYHTVYGSQILQQNTQTEYDLSLHDCAGLKNVSVVFKQTTSK